QARIDATLSEGRPRRRATGGGLKTVGQPNMTGENMMAEPAVTSGTDEAEPGIADAPTPNTNLDTILGIPVTVQVVLGSAVMPVSSLMKMEQGSVILLDQ